MASKSSLAIALSKLNVFISPDTKLEQYATDSEIAADVLWTAKMLGDIEGKKIIDLGCGTGILGIGALLLGAEEVIFVDKDKKALALLNKNLDSLDVTEGFRIVHADIAEFDDKADVVIENPPFGTRERHIDKDFLSKAFSCADIVYSFHKTATKGFVDAFSKDNRFAITHRFDFRFPLKQTMSFHTKRIERIDVSCFRLLRNKIEK